MEEKKVILYSRKSKEKETSESCQNQISQGKEKVAYMNQDPANKGKMKYVIIDEIIDDGHSGGTMDRPGMNKIKGLIEKGKVDVIVVYKLDRLSRKLRDILEFIEDLAKYKVDIVSVTEREVDTVSAMGKAFFTITMVFAELERNLASERSKDNNRVMAQNGYFMGSYIPYGFTAEKKVVSREGQGEEQGEGTDIYGKLRTVLSHHIQEVEVVRRIFDYYLQGNYSFARIASILNSEGILKKQEWNQPKKNEKWSESNIANMIREFNYVENTLEAYNYLQKEGYEFLVGIEKFTGGKSIQVWDKKITILDVESIIPSDIFISVQKMRVSKVKTKNHVKMFESKILLASGILKCPHCGKPLTADVTKGKKRDYGYYYCYNKECSNYMKLSNCKMEILDKKVLDKLKAFFKNKELVKQILEADYKVKKSNTNSSKEKIQQIQKQIQDCEKTIRNMTNAISNFKDNDTDEAQELIANYQSEQLQAMKKKKELAKALENVNMNYEEVEEKLYNIQELLDCINNFGEVLDKATPERRKRLVHFLVKEIVVHNHDKFKIQLFFYEDFPGIYNVDLPDDEIAIVRDNSLNNGATSEGVKWKRV